jgi:glycosyltransferase involved in cell wall biosynthesis
MRVLLICSRFPWPPWRGNQVRTVQWAEALREHEVRLVCPAAPAGTIPARNVPVTPIKRSRSAAGVGLLRAALDGRPLQEGLYDGPDARRAVASAVREHEPDVVVVQMVRCAWALEAARAVARSVPVIFDAIDAMGLHFECAARSSAPWMAPLYRAEARRCRRREAWLAHEATRTTAVAERDLAALAVAGGRGRVIPVAVRAVEPSDPERAGPVVLLSGNLGYRPTVDGALWFAREVWPLLRRRIPAARWVLAGARPAAAVRRLARLEGVEVHADVPDLGAHLRATRVSLAPMSSGSGVPMKVLEAMASGVPALVHPWAADGLASEAAGAVTVADGSEAWVEALVRLLDDAVTARTQGELGREAWRRLYHPEVVADQIRSVVAEAAVPRQNLNVQI